MSGTPKTRPSPPAKGPRTYRGVKVGKAVGRSQFTASQIRKAVKDAIAKNADALVVSK